jgi:hypothetical protein
MSGDIGAGTTKATLRLAQKVLQMDLRGHVQLAGGTNQATIPQLPSDLTISGVAYGSYARQLVATVAELPDLTDSESLTLAVTQARRLVDQVKTRQPALPGSPPSHHLPDLQRAAAPLPQSCLLASD